MSEKRKALGRGLAALLPGAPGPAGAAGVGAASGAGDGLRRIAIEDVHPARHQPRKSFDGGRLQELADSIRTQGIIQPLVVRPRGQGGYELIAGERRWRAAQRAGLHELPVIVRDASDTRAFEMALVENLQREDLNPIDEAEGFERLIADFDHTQESLAARVGKDRSTVANSLRLLKLPPSVRALVSEGRLSMGHARALLGLDSSDAIERLARLAVARGLSVRQVEAFVRRARAGAAAKPDGRPGASPAARDLALRLQRRLGARVRLVETGPGRGQIEIRYHSLDELDAVLAKILPE